MFVLLVLLSYLVIHQRAAWDCSVTLVTLVIQILDPQFETATEARTGMVLEP